MKGIEMKKLFSTLCAGVLALGTGLTSIAPVNAAPFVPAPVVEKASDTQNIQYRRWRDGPRHGGYYRRGGDGWYNGHRGYRTYRHGYRRHGDFWFPAGAFIAGALIGGALAAPAPRYVEPEYRVRRVYRGGGNAHVQWCYDRYRSYRAYDNTYQPYDGPRAQCYSPYS